MAKSMFELLEDFSRQERLTRLEGEEGVRNLARIAKAIGYKDDMYFGQFLGGSIGDLLEFLNDNPGAQEAIYNWISERELPEWKEKLQEQLPKEEESEE